MPSKYRIQLTFKDKEKDLYDEAMKHSSPQAWIKDMARERWEYLKKLEENDLGNKSGQDVSINPNSPMNFLDE